MTKDSMNEAVDALDFDADDLDREIAKLTVCTLLRRMATVSEPERISEELRHWLNDGWLDTEETP